MLSRLHLRTIIALLALTTSGWALPLNGDFSSGLSDWGSQGQVDDAGEAARLTETSQFSELYQSFLLAPGVYSLHFDLDPSGLAPYTGPDVGFPDLLAVTLYTFDVVPGNPPTFDPNAPPAGFIPLLDLGVGSQMLYDGVLSASPLGGTWQRYSLTLQIVSNAVAFSFLLTGQDPTVGNSTALIDNVFIAQREPVPIPEPVHLTVLGLAILAWRRRGRSSE